jgi:PAS domain S-box-containing protein
MFGLLRYYSFTSAVAVVTVTAVLLALYRQSAVNDLVEQAEFQNVALARSLANTIWPRFSAYVKSTPGMDGESLQARPETQEIHETLRMLTAGLPVLGVKIYNLDGLTVFSSKRDQIGVTKSNNPGLMAAAEEGRPVSRLTYRDTISSFEDTIQDRDVVESYLPIRFGDGPVEAVFELYSDVTPLVSRIERSMIDIAVAFSLIFGLLYGGLLLIVRRADRILKQQYGSLEREVSERKQAEAALKKAHDRLEQSVRERTRDLTEEIAEREQAEQNLRKLSRAVEQSPAMTIITDLHGHIEYVNPRFTEVTGYTLGEVRGKTPRVLKSGDKLPDDYDRLWKTITAGKEWRGEMHNRKKNGELYWASTSISPVTDQDRKVTHFLGIAEDITEHKRVEQEARQQRNELAHAGRVIVMGEMATSLAHELNQPLAVISGCAQACVNSLQSGRGKPEELSDALGQLTEQAERANNIIRRIRSFIQKEEPEMAEININETIHGIAGLLRTDAREHQADIELDLCEDLPSVIADPVQIQQVILNLAHNGMEAMDECRSSPRHLTIRSAVRRHGTIEVAVQDTGPGLPAESLDRVFDHFFSTKSSGLGMGLPISRSIIEAHGGSLWAAREGEAGAVFRFTLPAIDEGRSDDA